MLNALHSNAVSKDLELFELGIIMHENQFNRGFIYQAYEQR